MSAGPILKSRFSTRAALGATVALALACGGISRDEFDRHLAGLKVGTVPVGSVVAYAGDTLPAGWLWCDGTEYDIGKYPALAQAIRAAHGSSDPGSKFRVPDYRGRFLRGVDRGAQRAPDAVRRQPMAPGGSRGDAVGTVESDQLGAHSHEVKKSSGSHPDGTERLVSGNSDLPRGALVTNAAGGSETRPMNAAVNWIIRAQ